MDEKQVEVIRKSSRDILFRKRQVLRDEESDVHRKMHSIPPDNITAVINKLKNKSSVTASVLCIVKNSLMDGPEYIDLVLSTQGALRGLIRELSGHDALKQTAAAGCLCNLALGDAKASLVVAKAAGPYLIAVLDNLAMELAVTCAWTLGNLAASGRNVSEVLISQGTLNKLLSLLQSSNEESIDAAEYALMHFVYQMKDELSNNFLSEILQACLKSELTMSSAQIIFILSCHKAFMESVSIEYFLQKLLQELSLSITYHNENCTKIDFCCKLVYITRILSNLQLNNNIYNYIMNYLLQNRLELFFITILSKDSEVLIDSLFWLLGNLINFDSRHVFFNSLIR